MKFLISFFIFALIFSCKEIQNNKVSTKVNEGIKKIEKIIEKKDDLNNQRTIKDDKIFYFIGEPYFIEGVEYIPKENYKYSEIGIATYYGKELHNVQTINNDFNKVTELLGRHKTLPIPSMVNIKNLDNGLSINVKIVDRHDDNASLINVSRKVAQLLGFYKNKVATVRVEILSDASKQWKNVSMSLNEPQFDETISSAPTEEVSISNIDISSEITIDDKNYYEPIELLSENIEDYNLFLKIFKFNNYQDIQSIMKNLSADIDYTSENNGNYYDLVIGPIDNIEIKNLVSYFISKGYKDTKIILN